MKITETILSIPPYLSTTWKDISSLHVREENEAPILIVLLKNRIQIEVPHLSKAEIDEIFEAHVRASEIQSIKPTNPLEGPFSFQLPLKMEGGLDTLGPNMQHNPEQADLPPIPPDVLNKITMIARAFGLENSSLLPKAEPHCNCVYCQIARSMQGEEKEPIEVINDRDLEFRDWDIKQKDKDLYSVTNPLDETEHYSVFLGTPLGCTCGSKNCEHIRAVLNT